LAYTFEYRKRGCSLSLIEKVPPQKDVGAIIQGGSCSRLRSHAAYFVEQCKTLLGIAFQRARYAEVEAHDLSQILTLRIPNDGFVRVAL